MKREILYRNNEAIAARLIDSVEYQGVVIVAGTVLRSAINFGRKEYCVLREDLPIEMRETFPLDKMLRLKRFVKIG